jgi:hypothetical protein
MNSPAPGPGDATAPDNDAACWQVAKQLRSEHPKWLVIWVARTRRYHAYRLSGFRPGTGLTDTQPAGLATQIEYAERAAASRPARPRRARTGQLTSRTSSGPPGSICRPCRLTAECAEGLVDLLGGSRASTSQLRSSGRSLSSTASSHAPHGMLPSSHYQRISQPLS